MLLQRLERVVVALALTLDAEAAAAQRLGQMDQLAGAHRIGRSPADEWALRAQRYRDVMRTLESINEEAEAVTGEMR
jgi:hypothetical protein